VRIDGDRYAADDLERPVVGSKAYCVGYQEPNPAGDGWDVDVRVCAAEPEGWEAGEDRTHGYDERDLELTGDVSGYVAEWLPWRRGAESGDAAHVRLTLPGVDVAAGEEALGRAVTELQRLFPDADVRGDVQPPDEYTSCWVTLKVYSLTVGALAMGEAILGAAPLAGRVDARIC